MRIAHLSDLHVYCLDGAVPFRLLNKRLTGYANLRLKRGHHHRTEAVHAVAAAIREARVDHVVVTGDVSNLALECEFEIVQALLARDFGLSASEVSIVPGNHDAYTRGSYRSLRFERYFAAHQTSDLPELAVPGDRPYPYVRLRGALAIIGLSTAVPRPPFVAAGVVGAAQCAALRRVVEHPEVARRTPIILQHHPWHNPGTLMHRLLEGLHDAEAEGDALGAVRSGLLLHGHLHRRIHREIRTRRGVIDAFGATSASLIHPEPLRMSGFNVYEFDAEGALCDAKSFALESLASPTLVEAPLPRAA